MVEDGTCGAFDILNAMFGRVLIMFVVFILLAPYPISAKNLAHNPNKLFLCIIRPDVDWNVILAEAGLKGDLEILRPDLFHIA